MKKLIVACSLFASFSAVARGGGENGGGGFPLNSMALLVHEASEKSLRLMISSDPQSANLVSGMDSQVIDPIGTTAVSIELGAQRVVKYLCTPFDDLSHGGTIVKKEMACRPN